MLQGFRAEGVLVLVAFLATLASYVGIVIFDETARPLEALENLMLLEGGALAALVRPSGS